MIFLRLSANLNTNIVKFRLRNYDFLRLSANLNTNIGKFRLRNYDFPEVICQFEYEYCEI